MRYTKFDREQAIEELLRIAAKRQNTFGNPWDVDACWLHSIGDNVIHRLACQAYEAANPDEYRRSALASADTYGAAASLLHARWVP